MTLELDGLGKAHAGFELGPLDLSVEQEVLSVLGPSGCGKTTLLWLIAGITRPDSGSITLNDRSLDELAPEDRNTGLVFQDGALFPNMTVEENISYASSDAEYAAELAAMLEIEDVLRRRPRTLSGGERQRVALARTLATKPDALLLDEPLSSLDAPIRRRLRNELHDLFTSLAIPVVLVTHDQRTATALGDRIAVLRDGLVEQVGPPNEILRRPTSRFVATFTGNENLFEAQVVDQHSEAVTLRSGDVRLQATAEWTGDAVATVCIHPSRVHVRLPLEAPLGNDENTIAGTIHHWLNEGDDYRVVIGLDGAALTLTATVSPPVFERLSVESGSDVHVGISPEAVHLISTAEGDEQLCTLGEANDGTTPR
ncbi:MAG: ABC transporter ATP-binding protein [Halobacteriota archaeon]